VTNLDLGTFLTKEHDVITLVMNAYRTPLSCIRRCFISGADRYRWDANPASGWSH